MIPTIEEIVRSLIAGSLGEKLAISWLERHVEMARERADLEDLRDHFAAKVLPAVYAECCESTRGGDPVDRGWRDDVAMGAYKLADAMLEARKQ